MTPSMERPSTPGGLLQPSTPGRGALTGAIPPTFVGPVINKARSWIDVQAMPIKFVDKMARHYDRIKRVWNTVMQKSSVLQSGQIAFETFLEVCDKMLAFGLSEREVHQLSLALDKEGTGSVDVLQIFEIFGGLLHPQEAQTAEATSLQINPMSKDDDPDKRGKVHRFNYDNPVAFNNAFRQTLDESGRPLLRNIFRGKFTATDHPADLMDECDPAHPHELYMVPAKAQGKNTSVKPLYLEYDKKRQIPMIQSVIQGTWYGDEEVRKDRYPLQR